MLWKEKPSLENVKSIQWGENESVAREEYKKIYNCQVQEVGLFISKANPLVGASPDGLLENGRGLLEIKCPYGLRENNLKEDLKQKSNCTFFTVANDKLYLRRDHPYHYQIQCQMYVMRG